MLSRIFPTDWFESLYDYSNYSTSSEVQVILSSNYFNHPLPTWYAGGSPSLLDPIWINSIRTFSTGIMNSDITDHCPNSINFFTVTQIHKLKLSFRVHDQSSKAKFKQQVTELSRLVRFINCQNEIAKTVFEFNKAHAQSFPLKIKCHRNVYVSPGYHLAY